MTLWRNFIARRSSTHVARRFLKASSEGDDAPVRCIGPLKVSPIGIDASELIQRERDEAGFRNKLRTALNSSASLIDASSPDGSRSIECMVGSALKSWKPENEALLDRRIVIATQGGLIAPGVLDCSPETLVRQCDETLEAFQRERVDVFVLSGVDDKVPLKVSLEALAQLRADGKIECIGIADVPSKAMLDEAMSTTKIDCVKNVCSVAERGSVESGVLGYCDKLGIAFLATRPFSTDQKQDQLVNNPIVAELAKKHHVSPFQICLAWLMLTDCTIPLSGHLSGVLKGMRFDDANAFKVSFDLKDLTLFEELQSSF